MPPPQATSEFVAALARLQVVLIAAGRRAWARMGPNFDPSWAEVAPPLVAVTSAAQLAAANAAVAYVPAVLAETGQPDAPDAIVRPRAFAGVAADGRSLEGLLTSAVVRAKTASARGLGSEPALAEGGRWLDALLQGAVVDAGRGATTAGIATREHMGWVRQVTPPCCSRCAILAGHFYRHNQGFQRHPRCDCVHIPAMEDVAGSLQTSPAELFANGQVTGLTRDQQQRIAAGENRNKVVNESRDMWRARLSDQRASDGTWGSGGPRPATTARQQVGIEDLLANLTNRVDALKAMKSAGYVE